MKVMVIDDNKNITEVIKDYFDLANIDCTSVNNSYESLNELRKNNYDLVLLDLAMPEFSGLDILKELTSSYIKSKNFVILTASMLTTKENENLLSFGVKEILNKPVSLNDLDILIKKYLAPNDR